MESREKGKENTWRSPQMLLLYLVAVIFTGTQIGSGITVAILPLYLLSLGVSLTTMGFLYSILNLLSGLIRTPVGIVSDTTGPRPFILSGLFISIAALTSMTLASGWKLATLAMILTGIGSGVYFPMLKKIAADETEARDRVKSFMVISLIFSTTGIVGPTIAGLIVEAYGLRSVFLVALSLSILGPLACSRIRLTSPGDGDESIGLAEMIVSVRSLGRNAALLGTTNFLRTMTWGVSSAFIPVYLQQRFELTYSGLGFYMSLSAISALIGPPLASRFPTFQRRSRFVMLAQPLLLPLNLGLALIGRLDIAVASLLLINLVGSMIGPMMDTLISDIAPPGKLGSAYGVIDTFLRIGISAGNIIGGYVADNLGFQALFIISGLIAASTSLPLFLLRRRVARIPLSPQE